MAARAQNEYFVFVSQGVGVEREEGQRVTRLIASPQLTDDIVSHLSTETRMEPRGISSPDFT